MTSTLARPAATRWVGYIGLTVLATLVLTAAANLARVAPQAPTPGPDTRVVLIGTGGITWPDVSPRGTPALWNLLSGAAANLTIAGVHPTTCPVDAWTSLSAGDRAGQPEVPGTSDPACPPMPTASGGEVSGYATLVAAAQARPYGAVPGTLAARLADAGQCVGSVGPGADLAAAGPTGAVTHPAPSLAAALDGPCRVVLVDIGAVADQAGPPADRIRRLDHAVARLLTQVPDSVEVLVASFSDEGRPGRLGLLGARGPAAIGGLIASASTRHTGLAQSSDLTATLLARVGVDRPASLPGAELADDDDGAEPAERWVALADTALAAERVTGVVLPFFLVWALAMIALMAVALRRRSARASRLLVLGAAVPIATYLANLSPWWRSGWPGGVLTALVLICAGALGAIALLGPWRRSLLGPTALVSGVTLAVLGVDVMTGSRLQVASLLGLNPAVGGRFYGLGNVAFALFAAAAVLLCVAVGYDAVQAGRRRSGAALAGALSMVAVVVDAAPRWGADVGGAPALVPALTLVMLAILGAGMTWRRWVVVLGVVAGLLVVLGLADYRRPAESRSHLGRFVASLLDSDAGPVVGRKLTQNLDLLLHAPFAMLVPIVLAVLLYAIWRPESLAARPWAGLCVLDVVRPGLVALGIVAVVGLLLNDTGIAIPAIVAALALPLLTSVAARVGDRAEEPATPPHETL